MGPQQARPGRSRWSLGFPLSLLEERMSSRVVGGDGGVAGSHDRAPRSHQFRGCGGEGGLWAAGDEVGAQPEGAVVWTCVASAAGARRRPQRPREVGVMLWLLGCMWGERGEVLEDGALLWGLRNGGQEVGHELTGGAVHEPEGR